MEAVTIETELGPVVWTARPEVFQRSGPLLLLIRGAFADPESLNHLPEFVDVDCALANLPGHASPYLTATSLGVFSAAYRKSIETAFPGRPLVVVGLSVGGLLAMGLRLPQIRRLVLIDPPLSTDLPPLTRRIRTILPTSSPEVREFCWQIFGVSETEFEARDYSGLLNSLRTPADVLLGGMDEETDDALPRLNHADAYKGHPFVSRHIVPWAGHNIPAQASDAFLHVVRQACASFPEEA